MLALALALTVGQWTVDQKSDFMNAKAQVTARLQGKGGSISFICGGGDPPLLAFQSHKFLGGGTGRYELRDFFYRFDDGPPKTESWKYVRDVAVPYSQDKMVAFAMRMIQARKLVVRAKLYDRSTVDATFDLRGSAQAFNEAFARCGMAAK